MCRCSPSADRILRSCSASSADVEFYVEGSVAHVADTSLVRKHSDYFVKQINKLEEIISTLK